MFTGNGQHPDSLIDKKQAAHYLGISGATLERLMRSGLPYIKLTIGTAGAVRFSVSDLAGFVAARRVRSAGADSEPTHVTDEVMTGVALHV